MNLRRLLKLFFWMGWILWSGLGEAKVIQIEWDSLSGATAYELQLFQKEKKIFEKKIENRLIWKGDLPPGVYSYQVRGIDGLDRPGEWTKRLHLVVLPPIPKLETPSSLVQTYTQKAPLSFYWKPIPSIQKYHLQLYQAHSQKQQPPLIEAVTEKTTWTFPPLPAGSYSATIRGILVSPPEEHSLRSPTSLPEWKTPSSQPIELEIKTKTLSAPQIIFPQGALAPPKEPKTIFQWKPVEGAEAYEFRWGKTPHTLGKKYQIQKGTTLSLPRLPHGSYAWSIRALAGVQTSSKERETLGPETQAEFIFDPSEIFQARSGYLALSLMAAPYEYEIKNIQMNFNARSQAVATVLRASGEYWMTGQGGIDVKWDYTTLQMNNKSGSQNTLTAHWKYRTKLTRGENGWFFSPKLGVEVRDYSQLYPTSMSFALSNFSESTSYLTSTALFGLHAGFDLRKQWNPFLSTGIQTGYFYPLSVLGKRSLSRSSSASTRNWSLGIQGIYWVSASFGIGLGGYFELRSIQTTSDSFSERIQMDASYFFGSVIYRFW